MDRHQEAKKGSKIEYILSLSSSNNDIAFLIPMKTELQANGFKKKHYVTLKSNSNVVINFIKPLVYTSIVILLPDGLAFFL